MAKKRPTPRKRPAAAANERLEQAKLEALKELAYGASHEINNPLANISTRAQTLLRQETDPEKRRMLAAIHAQAMRAHEMIADLMLFARPPQLNMSQFDLVELVNRVIGEVQQSAAEQQTQLLLQVPNAPLTLEADATQLTVAVRAILQNSLEALGTGGQIEVTVNRSRKTATIEISDSGPGIPAEARPHIFEPFFSGREAGRGLGFGLSKCWRIVTDHGGKIDVTSSGDGTRFFLHLPA